MKRKYNILLLLLLGYFLPTKAFVSVDTVKNYAQLRSYIGEADSIYVAHERYYGWFVKANCGEEDYGTIIVTNQTCWRRILQNYHPRYWAIGSAAQDNLIKQIELEIDAINSAAFAAWKAGGDTIEIDRIYNIDQAVYLLPNNTYLGTTDSAGFKRIDPPKTVLTDTAKVGTKRLLVKSTEGFRAFQKINISNGQAFDSIAGHVSYNASIASDTVMFLNGRSIIKQMSPGDTISLFFRMMETRYSSADTILLKNLIFDGNRQHYTLNYDWRVNATIKLPTTTNATLEKCRFYNIPSENVFLCGAKVIGEFVKNNLPTTFRINNDIPFG